jgi:hypothetical protein
MICGMCEVGVGAMATLLQGCDGCGFPGLLPFCDGGCLTRAARAAAVLPYSCAASYGEASLPACFILRSESDYRAQLWLHPVGLSQSCFRLWQQQASRLCDQDSRMTNLAPLGD